MRSRSTNVNAVPNENNRLSLNENKSEKEKEDKNIVAKWIQKQKRKRKQFQYCVLVFVVLMLILFFTRSIDYERNYTEDIPQHNKQNNSKISLDNSKISFDNPNENNLIPKVLIFTHYINLLNNNTNNGLFSRNLSDEDMLELKSLQSNVYNTINLHKNPGSSNTQIRFLTDQDCINSLSNVLNSSSHPLLTYFQKESKGMYKADLCRGAALYETGGYYFDVDIQARLNLFQVLKPSTDFVTIKVHAASNWRGAFFQAFIGATKHHEILWEYLMLFQEYYEHKIDLKRGPLGVILLRMAYDRVRKRNNLDSRTEIWQEIRYNHSSFPSIFPDVIPTVGKRRACHMIVYIPHTRIVPFYSRVRGSRMCGGKESHK